MAFGDNQVAAIDPITQSREQAALKRSIAVYEKGLIVSYAVAVSGDSEVDVEVSDTLPANWDVDKVAFHPKHGPDDGAADQNTVEFTVRVDPDGFRMVKVGARPALDKSVEEIESDQNFSQPTIASISPIGDGDADDDGANTLIDGSTEESAIEDPSALDSNGGQSAPASPADASAGTPAGAGEDSEDASDSILPSEDAEEAVGAASMDSGESAAEDPESLQDLFGDFQEGATSTADDMASGPTAQGPGTDTAGSSSGSPASAPTLASPGEESPTNGSTADPSASPTVGSPSGATESPTVGSPTGSEAAPKLQSTGGSGSANPDDRLLPRLLDELEGGDPSQAELDRLRSVIDGLTPDDGSDGTRSTAVRVEELESRLEEFEAYTDALGDLLDSGEPAAMLDGIREELDSLRDEVGALQQDVKEVHDRQDTVEVRIESIVSDLEHILATRKS